MRISLSLPMTFLIAFCAHAQPLQGPDTLWTRSLRATQDYFTEGRGNTLVRDEAGNLYLSGVISQPTEPADVFVTKVSASGDSLWTRRYGTTEFQEEGGYLGRAANGDLLLLGLTEYTPSHTQSHGYPARLDLEGNVLWDQQYIRSADDCFYAIAPAQEGGFVITGASGGYVMLLRVTETGDTLSVAHISRVLAAGIFRDGCAASERWRFLDCQRQLLQRGCGSRPLAAQSDGRGRSRMDTDVCGGRRWRRS